MFYSSDHSATCAPGPKARSIRLGKLVGRFLLPAQSFAPAPRGIRDMMHLSMDRFASNAPLAATVAALLGEAGMESMATSELLPTFQLARFEVVTSDGAWLDTLDILPAGVACLPPSERTYIIRFNGNGDHYESGLAYLVRYADELSAAVVGFNYRGVGHSRKAPAGFHELVIDGISQVERVLELGVRGEHIVLDGHSLGGAVASYVGAYYHTQHGHRLRVFNDRSFAALAPLAADVVARDFFAKTLLGGLSQKLIRASGWGMEPLEAYLTIPPAYRLLAYSPEDRLIGPAYSLAAAVGGRTGAEEGLAFSVSVSVEATPLSGSDSHGLERDLLFASSKQGERISLTEYFKAFVREAAREI